MKIKVFICGLCKNEKYKGTRAGLRKHLREEHRIMTQITNKGNQSKKKGGDIKQSWWGYEEK